MNASAEEPPTSGDRFPSFTAAAVQAAPVFLDREATLDKLATLVAEAARRGARLIAFSESFVPAFPVWNLVLAPLDQHHLFRALYENAVPVPSEQTDRMAALARRHDVYLSVGITERSAVSMGAVYNTNLLFDPSGRLLNRHRKLVPTWAEKLTWAPGDGSQLRPAETEIGRIGALICGENTNTLARYALLAQGEQVHIASYPPAWPFRRPGTTHNYNLTRAIEIRSAAHAFEGKVFNIVSSGVLDEHAIQEISKVDPRAEEVLRSAPPSASMVIHPTGEVCGGPVVGDEDIVYAAIDVADSIEAKQAHDIVGYYQRFDIFRLQLDQRPQRPIELIREPRLGDEAPPEVADSESPEPEQ
ncbi:MAG: carbon-nitrogen hydrolase family protein [Actinomycetota bacterium]|nr:carbon-nitrogen hydrolase family protein [Actinomycetota bacterium]